MKEVIAETVKVLKKGGVILYPTDTIWGLGCDPTNEDAISAIFNIKQRDTSKSMLVLVDSIEMLEKYVVSVPKIAYGLIEVADKPLTIIYPKAKNLSKNILAADGSIGIRIPKNDFCLDLIKEFGKPIISTSANSAGKKSPLGYFDIENAIKMSVDFIVPLHLEELSIAKSSDIIKISKNGQIEVIR
ncbi:MAG TPA: L-threonylcarbamoyladenylate synthase [Bacteroidales bacterium]|nr:L-threonylcarbamoyladenylate synthase [Bacteroidales bacterium]